jgi:hypothetical protein
MVVAPGPVVAEPVLIPDYYVWDGVEYVGVVGTQYVYLGPGNIWLICDGVRFDRFHRWESVHRDWRVHAIRNDRFRTDRSGRVHPRGEAPGKENRGGKEQQRDDRH